MALSRQDRRRLLERELPASNAVRNQLTDYLARTGMMAKDFAARINYSSIAVKFFMSGEYHNISGNDRSIRSAILSFIAAHPIAAGMEGVDGRLHETHNVRLLRRYFYEALDKQRAYYVQGDPGTQKSFVLQHLIAELNRADAKKNGDGRSAYYVYCRQGVRPKTLLKCVAEAAGALTLGDVHRLLRNLQFEFQSWKTLLVFDEAQHLSIDCLETVRELYDRPPHCGLLFAGSHHLERIFTQNAVLMEQWNSRFYAGKTLPGISHAEATEIVRRELGEDVSRKRVARLLKGSEAEHFRRKASDSSGYYISARKLFNTLRDVKEQLAGSNQQSTA